jgi:membrane protease YdiL (CAAX protease family)
MAAPADAAPVRSPEEEAAQRRLGWVGLGVAALSFLGGFMAASILGVVYASVRGFDQAEAEKDFAFATIGSVGLWVGFLGIPLLWAWQKGWPVRTLGLSARWVDLPLGIAVGLASTVVTAVVSSAVLTTGQENELEAKAEEIIDRAHGLAAIVVLVVTLCVLTPVAEEVFFRGLLFRSLRRVTMLVVALPVSALIFGLVHFTGGPASVVLVQLGMLTLFGAALCAVVHATGRLGPSIMAHAVFNGVTVVSLLAQR